MKKSAIIILVIVVILIAAYVLRKKMGTGVFDIVAIDSTGKKVKLQERSGGAPIEIDLTSEMSTSLGKNGRFTIEHKKVSDSIYQIMLKDDKYKNMIVNQRPVDLSKDLTSQLGPL